jgi:hypothetical protein
VFQKNGLAASTLGAYVLGFLDNRGIILEDLVFLGFAGQGGSGFGARQKACGSWMNNPNAPAPR